MNLQNKMKNLLFKPSLYTNDIDFDLFGVEVHDNFWNSNLREQYTFAFQDKIENSLKVNKIDSNLNQIVLTDNWQLSFAEAIQFVDDKDRDLAVFITETEFCDNLISDFVKRLEIIRAGKTLENYYKENGFEGLGLIEPPEIEYFDFVSLSSLLAEY